MNTKITIKSEGVKLKTTDVGLALQVLSRLDEGRSVMNFMKKMFEGIRECTDEDCEEKEEEKKEKKPATRAYKPRKKINRVEKFQFKKGFPKRTWTEEEYNIIEQSLKAGLANKDICRNKVLLQKHTAGSIGVRVSAFRKKLKNNNL